MKVLWHSNAPWTGTGYGEQTATWAERFNREGHPTAVSAFYGLHGTKMNWNGLTVYPGGADGWGNDVVTAHALHWFDGDLSAGIILTLMDVWTLKTPSLNHFTVASWCPVDHDPIPPEVLAYFRRSHAVPIAMSRFGETKMREAGLDPMFVPHSVDTSVYRPRTDAREALGWSPDWFVVGMVAANKGATPPRKSFPQVFDAFARFARNKPEARLYLHTEQLGVNLGLDLLQLAAAYGISDRLLWPDQYLYRIGIPRIAMSYIYSGMDVLANPSYGEGFGIPIIEAQACGVPVIVGDNTAQPELVGWGWKAPSEDWWNPRQGSFYGYVSPKGIYEALGEAWKTRKNRGRSKVAVAKAAEYSDDNVWNTYWKPVLATIEGRLPSNPKPASLDDLAMLVPAEEPE